jgi:hypothetical protein
MVKKLSASPKPINKYRGLQGTWERPFTNVFNQYSKDFKLNPLHENLTLKQILLHFKGLYGVNHLFLVPDGNPLLFKNEFLYNIS